MHSAETRITTAHASKYLQQLCRHWAHKLQVEFSPTHGEIVFGEGRACVLDADEDGLTIVVSAPDVAQTARLGDVVVEHLNRFAFREILAATAWVELPA